MDFFPSPSGHRPPTCVQFQSFSYEQQSEAWGLRGRPLPSQRPSQHAARRGSGGRKRQLEAMHGLHHEASLPDKGKGRITPFASFCFQKYNICLTLPSLLHCSCFYFKLFQLVKRLQLPAGPINSAGVTLRTAVKRALITQHLFFMMNNTTH